MKRLIAPLLAMAMLLGFSDTALADPVQATSLEKVVAYTQPSVVYLDITWTGWVYDKYNHNYLNVHNDNLAYPFQLYFSCTGFFVTDDGYIATAGHCVDPQNVTSYFLDAAAQWAYENGYYADPTLTLAEIRGFADDDYRIEGEHENAAGTYTAGADLEVQAVWSTDSTESIYDSNGQLNGTPYGARVIELAPWNDGAGDTALLKVDATGTPALQIAPPGSISTGEDVTSVGYPGSVGDVSDATLSDPSFKEGSISSIRTNGLYPVYEISAPLSGGMSGGPTVDNEGRVVGINSYGIVGEDQAFSFVQASETLQEVMSKAGVDSSVGEPGTAYHDGLVSYFAGEKEDAVANLTKAVEAGGDEFTFASDFLSKATALPDPSNLMLPIVLAAALLLLLGAGGFFVYKKRQSATPSTVIEEGSEPTEPYRKVPTPGMHYCRSCGSRISNQTYCPECGMKQ